jgi:pyrroline-5-carboxylate reductase
MEIDGPLLLVGGGKMGGALVAGWLDGGVDPATIHVVEPGRDGRTALLDMGVRAVPKLADIPSELQPAVVVLAVKPQIMDDVLPPYARFVAPGTVFLSIAAGRTIASFARHLGENAAIVRSIPNTPAAIRRGMTVLCANANVSQAQRSACDTLLQGVGATGWVDDETLMDAATAVSGSGPAYVFHLIEAMAAAGVDNGLPAELAGRLAVSTVAGAGALAEESDEHPAQLRKNVTSPGGTTEAALTELMRDNAMGDLLKRAIGAATRRSRELAG